VRKFLLSFVVLILKPDTMKKLLLLLTITCQLSIITSSAQSPNWLWAKRMGGTSNDYGQSMAVDTFGNVYITGWFSGTVDFNPGVGIFNLTSISYWDTYISKLDASGNFVWAKAMGGTDNAMSWLITLDAFGNIYTTGYFEGIVDFDPGVGVYNLTSAGDRDDFISKLDSSGNFVWAKAMGGTGVDECYSIAVDASGYVYTTGYFQGTADFNPGAGVFNLTGGGIFISKLDSSGNFVWAKAMNGTGNGEGQSIVVDPAGIGDVYASGWFFGTVDFDPSVGVFNLTSAGNDDIYVSKLDSSGNLIWAKKMGGTGSDWGTAIALDHSGSGDVYTTGFFSATADFDPGVGILNLISSGFADNFVCKLDSSGNIIWAKGMGGTNGDWSNSIALDQSGSGDVYTTGFFEGTADFDPGTGTFNLSSAGPAQRAIFISKLDSSGNFSWAKSVGGTNMDWGQSIVLDAADKVYVTGAFSSPSISFGTTTLINGGSLDMFIAKLDTLTIPTGINEAVNIENGVFVFPNPAGSELRITNVEFRIESVEVFDVLGQKYNSAFDILNSELTIDVSSLSAGIYFIKVRTEKEERVAKFVKQ